MKTATCRASCVGFGRSSLLSQRVWLQRVAAVRSRAPYSTSRIAPSQGAHCPLLFTVAPALAPPNFARGRGRLKVHLTARLEALGVTAAQLDCVRELPLDDEDGYSLTGTASATPHRLCCVVAKCLSQARRNCWCTWHARRTIRCC